MKRRDGFLTLSDGMNILAHLILSGDNADVRFGNFIGDGVKGRNFSGYPNDVQRGISLHRLIDHLSETLQPALESRRILAKELDIFAPIALDIVYDHILASHWNNWHQEQLREFTSMCYNELGLRVQEMPKGQAFMLPYMIKGDWLYNYQHIEGMYKALLGLGKRISSEPKLERAVDIFLREKQTFIDHFWDFYPQMMNLCAEALNQK